MRKYILSILLFFSSLICFSQEQELLKLNREDIEAIFLKQNLALIAEKMNTSIADAEIMQAKLWENPELSIADVNFWTTEAQREDFYGDFPNAPNSRQFSIELSQMITTAGKRRKEVAVQKVSKEIAVQEFGELLRELKTELRQNINEILYLQAYEMVISKQVSMLEELISAHERQVKHGNISKADLLRLQSSSLEMENELYQLKIELNSQLKTLKSLLHLPPTINVIIVSSDADNKDIILPALQDLYLLAMENRPDLKLQKLQTDLSAKTLRLEKAQRVPDITFSANYDRYAGLWKDYIGFGMSFDLPVFNRNQGNIKVAKLSIEQSQYLEQQVQNEIFNEIAEAYNNYEQSLKFYRKMLGNELFTELAQMMDVYAKNLLSRNISLLEFLDFMDSYQTSEQIFLDTQKSVRNSFEELQYTIGTDIK